MCQIERFDFDCNNYGSDAESNNMNTPTFTFKTSIRFSKVFFSSDAASGATATNSECEFVITNSSSERVTDSLFSFE